MINRRTFLTTAAAAGSLMTAPVFAAAFEVTHSPAQWKRILTPARYAVLREAATEKAHTGSLMGESSALNDEHRVGTYSCAGCALPVYASQAKFESGTGWPSFTAPLPGAVGTKADNSFFSRRTEVHCRRCGGHLGHVFDDGPKPAGKRYCMNALAMTFETTY